MRKLGKKKIKTKNKMVSLLLFLACLNIFGLGFASYNFISSAQISTVNGETGEITDASDFLKITDIEMTKFCQDGFIIDETLVTDHFYIDTRFCLNIDILKTRFSLKSMPANGLTFNFSLAYTKGAFIEYSVFVESIPSTLSYSYGYDENESEFTLISLDYIDNTIGEREYSFEVTDEQLFNNNIVYFVCKLKFDTDLNFSNDIYGIWKELDSTLGQSFTATIQLSF